MAATTATTVFAVSKQPLKGGSGNTSSLVLGSNLIGSALREQPLRSRVLNVRGKQIKAAAAVGTPPMQEIKEFVLPTWAEFELGIAPVYWKTMNGLPPTAGENLRIFYNPAAANLKPNEEFGIGFNGNIFSFKENENENENGPCLAVALHFAGGFNQPIMCGGEPRAMLKKTRGKADTPFYTIQICIPKHALNLIFSFTNGKEWDGPYRLQFQVPKAWQNKPIGFFNEGLAEELSREGACNRAIFPDTHVVITRCATIGNLTVEGGDRCNLDLVAGCTDPSSPLFNPDANVDDGSCLLDSDSEQR